MGGGLAPSFAQPPYRVLDLVGGRGRAGSGGVVVPRLSGGLDLLEEPGRLEAVLVAQRLEVLPGQVAELMLELQLLDPGVSRVPSAEQVVQRPAWGGESEGSPGLRAQQGVNDDAQGDGHQQEDNRVLRGAPLLEVFELAAHQILLYLLLVATERVVVHLRGDRRLGR